MFIVKVLLALLFKPSENIISWYSIKYCNADFSICLKKINQYFPYLLIILIPLNRFLTIPFAKIYKSVMVKLNFFTFIVGVHINHFLVLPIILNPFICNGYRFLFALLFEPIFYLLKLVSVACNAYKFKDFPLNSLVLRLCKFGEDILTPSYYGRTITSFLQFLCSL